MEQEEKYLQDIVKGLVDSKDDVRVTSQKDNLGVLFEISVAPEDMGRIIGKDGSVIKSVRHIMTAYGFKNRDLKYAIRVKEPAK